MQENITHTRKPAFRQGLMFGIPLGIFFVVCAVILDLTQRGVVSSTLILTGIGALIVAILGCLLAGVRASRQTGRIGTGALAGLWAGLISSVITGASNVVFFAVTHAGAYQILLALALVELEYGVLAAVFGLGIGALGSLIGKPRMSHLVKTSS